MTTGAYGFPLLAPDQVRSMRFVYTHELQLVLFPLLGIKPYGDIIAMVEASGGAADVFGWPDGAIVFWERPSPDTPLDEEKLEQAYYTFHRSVNLAQMKGYKC